MSDANHPAGTLYPRMRAVVETNRALVAGEAGARYAYRAALIDLAAAAEATAAELPAPTSERAREGRPSGWNIGRRGSVLFNP